MKKYFLLLIGLIPVGSIIYSICYYRFPTFYFWNGWGKIEFALLIFQFLLLIGLFIALRAKPGDNRTAFIGLFAGLFLLVAVPFAVFQPKHFIVSKTDDIDNYLLIDEGDGDAFNSAFLREIFPEREELNEENLISYSYFFEDEYWMEQTVSLKYKPDNINKFRDKVPMYFTEESVEGGTEYFYEYIDELYRVFVFDNGEVLIEARVWT